MFEVRKINILNFSGQNKVNKILYDCGKDMAEKYGLHHWDNSHFKNFIIVFLTAFRSDLWLVSEGGTPVATFYTKKNDNVLKFGKLGVSPREGRKGIGTFCISSISEMARQNNCSKLTMDVYEKSIHAFAFYGNFGFKPCGKVKSRKYTEIRMEKELN